MTLANIVPRGGTNTHVTDAQKRTVIGKGKTMIPKEVSEKHMAICNKCKERRFYAKRFDMHFDWIDCWYDCPNDYEHWKGRCIKCGESDGNETD